MPTALLLALLLPASITAAQDDPPNTERCEALLEQTSGLLSSEQYPAMLRSAKERQRLCPGPVSAFLVGLAQGNMVDEQRVKDPAQREFMRRDALRNLQAAAAGGQDLRPVWRFTTHQWIVHLQSMAPSAPPELGAVGVADGHGQGSDPYAGSRAVMQPPRGPSPFPYGPVALGGGATAALVAALVTGLAAADNQQLARRNTQVIGQALAAGPVNAQQVMDAMSKTSALQTRAGQQHAWSTALLVTGGIGTAAALIWYFVLPPREGFQWGASTPGGVHVTASF